jgi:DNA adenine methylase
VYGLLLASASISSIPEPGNCSTIAEGRRSSGHIRLMVPFLKWPGGKRWFVYRFAERLPTQFNRYIEPFLGGGSVYFSLRPVHAILGDTNEDLINAYRSIRDDWARVTRVLKRHHARHGEEHYYLVRGSRPSSATGKAARLIYLNRTCFNGVYRVNRGGIFNVPKGTKESVLLPTDNFEGISRLLSSATIVVSDFEPLVDEAGPGDFVFADPPYTVNHNENGFIKYNEVLFSWADQQRLAASLSRARERGAYIVATNANHRAVKRLYWRHGFSVRSVQRSSTVSCNASGRRHFGEVIITSD